MQHWSFYKVAVSNLHQSCITTLHGLYIAPMVHEALVLLIFNFDSPLAQLSSTYLKYRNVITWYRAEMAPLKVIFSFLPSWEARKKVWKRLARKQVLH